MEPPTPLPEALLKQGSITVQSIRVQVLGPSLSHPLMLVSRPHPLCDEAYQVPELLGKMGAHRKRLTRAMAWVGTSVG